MLTPESDRLDYGKQLNPPEGYELDSAIATTYSLDLNTLLAVPIALCFNDTLDGDIKGEKLALLEAIGQLKGKLKVFYQKGNIAYPPKYNRLYTLLEPCLHPVIPDGGEFSSFHPKLWLLRFVESDTPERKAHVIYRLIVLSRNLSFDRSWDVALSLDGKKDKDKADPYNNDWIDFLKHLLSKDKTFVPAQIMKRELNHLVWQAPNKFHQAIQLRVGGDSYGRPIEIKQQDNDKLLVVSPFLKSTGGGVNALDWLASFAPQGKKYLFSRAEELNSVGEQKLSDWKCFAINEGIVNGEERLELNEGVIEQQAQNLHAKIIINQKGDIAHWHLGSANATTAALGDVKNKRPRNTEMMVRMKGHKSKVGIDLLMKQWLGENPGSGLFVEHEFEEIESAETDGLDKILRKTVHLIISANWKLVCSQEHQENIYTLILTTDLRLPMPEGTSVKVGQLAISGVHVLERQMKWLNVDITNISALIPVHISLIRHGVCVEKQLIIEAEIELEGGDCRHEYILKSMVDSEEKLLSYVRLLLQVHPDKNDWLSFDSEDSYGSASSLIFSDSPIFEQLLMASSRHPKILKRIELLLKRLTASGVDIPDNFKELWVHFAKEIKH
jgi:hypothetical protein